MTTSNANPAEPTGTCRIPECDRPYFNHGHGCGDGLCAAHYRRKLRGRPLNSPVGPYRRGPWASIVEAAILLADAETDAEVAHAEKRLRNAVAKWSRVGLLTAARAA